MSDRDFEATFRQIAIQEASRDSKLRGTLEWLILGKTTLVTEAFLDNVDEADVAADIGERYALDPDGVLEAFDTCEEMIVQARAKDG